MLSASAAMLSALMARMTQPGLFIQIGLSSGTLYLSTRGDHTWNGHSWVHYDVRANGLAADGGGNQIGQLTFGARDGVMETLILAEERADWPVAIYLFDAAALASADPLEIFAGTGSSASGDAVQITCDLTTQTASLQFLPARYQTAEQGFTGGLPPGKPIAAGNEIYVLEETRG